jgi:hypothetical protein
MRILSKTLTGVVAVLAFAGQAQAASLIDNGDFEAPFAGFDPGVGFYNIGPAVDADTFAVPVNFGWTVSGDIDLIPSNNFGAALPNSGLFRIDLNGYGPGTISQMFNTVAGRVYNLRFDYSANGSGTANVLLGALSAGITGGGAAQVFSQSFVGTGGLQTLTIASTSGGTGGVVLDNISVSAVPEAATWAMLVAGFGMAGAAMRRRRTVAA